VIELVVPAIRDGQSQTVEANFDGTHKITLNTGDRIRIVQSEKTTEFLKINQVSFLEVLGRKMRDL
jgi:NAD+ kinase